MPPPAIAFNALLPTVVYTWRNLLTRLLAHWPTDASGALFAEVEHLRRIGELLPSLDGHLVRMILPKVA